MSKYKKQFNESKSFSTYDRQGNIKVQLKDKGNEIDIKIDMHKADNFDTEKFAQLLMKAIKGSKR